MNPVLKDNILEFNLPVVDSRQLVKYKCLLAHKIYPIKGQTYISGNRHKIELPKDTIGVKFTIKGYCMYVPERVEYDYKDKDRTTRLLFKELMGLCLDTIKMLDLNRGTRILGLVMFAIMESLVMFVSTFKSRLNLRQLFSLTSLKYYKVALQATMCTAASGILHGMCPQEFFRNGETYERLVEQVKGRDKKMGLTIGQKISRFILDNYATLQPLYYQKLGFEGEWIATGQVEGLNREEPLVIPTRDYFRCVPFPNFKSQNFVHNSYQIQTFRSDPTLLDTYHINLCNYWTQLSLPIYYNMLALKLCNHLNLAELIKSLTIINMGMADTLLAINEAKYFYRIARPSKELINTQLEISVEKPITNSPSFPSEEAGLAGFCCKTLKRIIGQNEIDWEHYATLDQLEHDAGQVGIYMGIHWNEDRVQGQTMGWRIAEYYGTIWNN